MQKMNHFIALQLLFGENIDVERLKFNFHCEVAYCLNQEPCLNFFYSTEESDKFQQKVYATCTFFYSGRVFCGLQSKQPGDYYTSSRHLRFATLDLLIFFKLEKIVKMTLQIKKKRRLKDPKNFKKVVLVVGELQ